MKAQLALLSIALALGCSSPPPPRAEPTPSPAAPASPSSSTPPASDSPPRDPVVGLTLEQALRFADTFHPYAALARAEIEAHEGRFYSAGSLPSTVVMARMESGRMRGRTFDQAEYLTGVLQTIPISGRVGATERIEERDRDHHLREAVAKRLEIHSKIRGAFATALYFDRVRQTHATGATHAERAVTIVKARVKSGDALPEDLARVEIELARAQLASRKAGTRATQATYDLVSSIGTPELKVESLAGSLDVAFEVPAIEALDEKLSEHPDLLAALAKVDVEDARIDLAERLKVPDMYVELYYRRLQHSNVDAFDAGFGFLLPLFDRTEGRLREARANRAAADARVRATRLELEALLRGAHARLTTALATARTLRDEVLPRSATVLGTIEKRHARGDASLAEVLPVRREKIEVELSYLEALREALEAWGTLLPFIGGAAGP